MSISTKLGDGGQTSLVGGRRVSKGSLRIEAVGTLDELVAHMGFARSICDHEGTRALLKDLQRELFAISEVIVCDFSSTDSPHVDSSRIDALTGHVNRLEQFDGMLLDWALPGEHTAAAAIDVARTTCRRAERAVVRLMDSGEAIDLKVVAYLNRLADLLWLLGRFTERDSATDARLRSHDDRSPTWSRAW